MAARTLREYLADPSGNGTPAPRDLAVLIEAISDSCRTISYAGLARRTGGRSRLGRNRQRQGEEQKQLDVLANDELMAMAKASGVVAAAASEEEDEARPITAGAPYLLLFDPLDGSSNIDVERFDRHDLLGSTGEGRRGAAPFLQTGRNQAAAGYCVYGPQTTLVLTLGHGVAAFTMDPPTGQFVQTGANIRIPEKTKEFAINMSNIRHWADPVRAYIDECLAGDTGPRAKNFNMRWIASMVADVHRVLSRGGVLHVPVGQARTRQARQATPDVRSQPDVAPRRTGRRQIVRRQATDPRCAADRSAPARVGHARFEGRSRSAREEAPRLAARAAFANRSSAAIASSCAATLGCLRGMRFQASSAAIL